jgi:hypothetical protein
MSTMMLLSFVAHARVLLLQNTDFPWRAPTRYQRLLWPLVSVLSRPSMVQSQQPHILPVPWPSFVAYRYPLRPLARRHSSRQQEECMRDPCLTLWGTEAGEDEPRWLPVSSSRHHSALVCAPLTFPGPSTLFLGPWLCGVSLSSRLFQGERAQCSWTDRPLPRANPGYAMLAGYPWCLT